MTNIREIGNCTFALSPNLKYFEFAEGIRVINQAAFAFTQRTTEIPSRMTSSVIGGTIRKIETNAFRRAFDPSVTSIEIGSKVAEIGKNAFGKYTGHGITNISIGSQTEPSELYLSSNSNNYPIFAYNPDVIHVQFYTTNPNYSVGSSYLTNNFGTSA
jgi:hypothetical protein